MLQTNLVEKIDISYVQYFFFRTSCNVQGNVEKNGSSGQATDYITRRMHLACWMTKDTDIQSEYVTLIAFPRNSRYAKESQYYVYTYIDCLVIYSKRTTSVPISTVGKTGNSYPPLAQICNSTVLSIIIS